MPIAIRSNLWRVALLLLLAAGAPGAGQAAGRDAGPAPDASAPPAPAGKAVATFAMGCFWCAEDAFEGTAGVASVVSGYTGGRVKNPTYEQVSGYGTGHYEAIQVIYDPAVVSYETLLERFWHNVDPFDGRGQFCDQGDQYRAAIFVHDPEQRRLAEASRQRVAQELQKGIVTRIEPAVTFYAAEEYHQDYAQRNPVRYKYYSTGCGRANRLRSVWGEKAGH